jgi:hypothetical protein
VLAVGPVSFKPRPVLISGIVVAASSASTFILSITIVPVVFTAWVRERWILFLVLWRGIAGRI